MSRVQIVDPKTATGHARRPLDAVQSQLGVTPNFIRVKATRVDIDYPAVAPLAARIRQAA